MIQDLTARTQAAEAEAKRLTDERHVVEQRAKSAEQRAAAFEKVDQEAMQRQARQLKAAEDRAALAESRAAATDKDRAGLDNRLRLTVIELERAQVELKSLRGKEASRIRFRLLLAGGLFHPSLVAAV